MKGLFRRIAIRQGFKLIYKFLIEVSKYDPLNKWLMSHYKPLEEASRALTDKNPNDQEQLAAIWQEYKGESIEGTLAFAQEIINDKVKDGPIKETILSLLADLDEEDLILASAA